MIDKINYQAWALYENLDVFIAAALWCDRNPYHCLKWDEMEYVEVRNLVLHILRHQLDAENYPVEKRNFVIMELAKRFDKGINEFLMECKKFILSRKQLKAIAEKNGVKPVFLFGNDHDLNKNFPQIKETEQDDELNNEIPSKYERNINFSIEELINTPVSELLSLSRQKPQRKPTLVAIADTEEEATQKLLDLVILEDLKQKLENELSRIQAASYNFEESRKVDLNHIKNKLEDINHVIGVNSNQTVISKIINDEDTETGKNNLRSRNFKLKNQRKRGPTKITDFLTDLCQQLDDVTARSLARAIKPLVGKPNCPVKKYHGFYDEVCVEWKPGSGSTKGTWGKKAFQNFVVDFKSKGSRKVCQD
ncbi:MAG: hypothetical protein ACXWT4_13275 [Methylobacter sp.]